MLDALETFDRYLLWFEQSGPTMGDVRIRLNFELTPNVALGGEISRIDYVEEGYRAVLLGPPQTNWSAQIRMPLIQHALASSYGSPDQEFQVGVQALDGSQLAVVRFNPEEIGNALAIARATAESVGSEITSVTPNSEEEEQADE